MTTYGLLPTGFVPKTIDVIILELEAKAKADIDSTIDTSPEQPLGQILGIMAEREEALWALLAVAYGANDRDKAEFFLLDSVGAGTGSQRKPATYSTVTLSCTLTSGTILTADVAKANVVGKPTDVWVCKTTFTAPSTGVHPVQFRAETKGPRAANAATITVINTPVAGWSAVTNTLAASVGALVETDAAYRIRQVNELAQGGSSSTVAIRAALLEIPEVLQALVFENTTASTNVDGMPPHSMQAIIWDGTSPAASNTVVAQALWDNKGGGIEYFGSTTANATDDEGNSRLMTFSRATQRQIYIDINVTQDPAGPTVTSALVKAALRAKAATYQLGDDVVALALRAAAFTVPGVYDVPLFELGFTAAPSGTANLTIGAREIAIVEDANITVNIV